MRSQRSDSSREVPSFKSPELALMTHGTDVSAFDVSVGGHAQVGACAPAFRSYQ